MSIDGKMSTDYTVIYRTHFHAFSKIASWNWYDSRLLVSASLFAVTH